jgi:hypothetical protein
MSDQSESSSSSDTGGSDNNEELERLKRECRSMVALLKELERDELELVQQTKILAREALLCGYQPHLLEPPAPKRRRNNVTKKPKAAASSSAAATTTSNVSAITDAS